MLRQRLLSGTRKCPQRVSRLIGVPWRRLNSTRTPLEDTEDKPTQASDGPPQVPEKHKIADLPGRNAWSDEQVVLSAAQRMISDGIMESAPWEKPEGNENKALFLKLAPGKKSPLQQAENNERFNPVDFERDLKNMVGVCEGSQNAQILKNLQELRPDGTVTEEQYKQLQSDVTKGFTNKQLQSYLRQEGVKRGKANTKSQLVQKVIDTLWQVKVSKEVEEMVRKEERIPLPNKRELFLLMANNGYIMNSWSRMGANLTINNEHDTLIVSGTPAIVKFVQVSWSELLKNVQSTTMKLKKLNKFYETELKKAMPIEQVQQLSNAYFDKISDADQLYQVSAFSRYNLDLARGALLAATDYSKSREKELDKTFIDDNPDLVFKKYTNSNLPWHIRADPLYRLKMRGKRQRESLLTDQVDPATLIQSVADLKSQVRTAQGNFERKFLEPKAAETADVHISDNQLSSDLAARVDLALLETKLLTSGQPDWISDVSASFGRFLYRGKDTDNYRYFDANLPETTKRLGQLPLLDRSNCRLFGATGGILTHSNKSFQMKLVPDAFKKFNSLTELPDVEVWFDITGGKVNLASCNVFVNEHEYSHDVPVPELKSDIRFQSSFNSMLIDSAIDSDETFGKKQHNLHKFLSRIPEEYLYIMRDPARAHRLFKSIQNRPVALKLNQDDKPVSYLITSVSTRQTMELEFRGLPVIYEVVRDSLGDHHQVSLLSDIQVSDAESTKQVKLDRFNRNAFRLAQFLQS